MLGLGSSLSSSSGVLKPVPFVNTTTNTYGAKFNNSQYLKIDDNDDFSFVDIPFSIAAWVKLDSTSSVGLFAKSHDTLSNAGVFGEYRAFLVSGELYVDVADGAFTQSSGYKRIKFGCDSTGWQHIVITSDGTSGENLTDHINLYINGVKQTKTGIGGSDTDGMSNQSGGFKIGVSNDSAPKYLDGQMLQYIMWRDYELNQSDVNYLYANGAAHRDPTADADDYGGSNKLLLWLPMQEDFNDDSGNGHNMTANGTILFTNNSGDVPF